MEDWALSDRLYRNIVSKYGRPDVDLMASNMSRKEPFFYSWDRRDTEALALDSLSQDINWAGWQFPYLFPPFSLIGPCLKKIRQQKEETLVTVLPYWPGKPWFSLMMMVDIRRLPVFKAQVVDMITGKPPLDIKSCRLVVCLLSGTKDKEVCQTEQDSWLRQAGGQPQRHSTQVVGENGLIGQACREYHQLRLL